MRSGSLKVSMIRVDRIGDLVLTLPCEKVWHDVRPQDQVTWVVSENLKFVIDAAQNIKAFFLSNPKTLSEKIKESLRLVRFFKETNFDVLVFFHAPWWVALAGLLSGTKARVGVGSQWYSFLFYNHKLRQKRSLAQKHEAEYNRDLVNMFLKSSEKNITPLTLQASYEKTESIKKKLLQEKVDLEKLVVVHPGMAGSARNWSATSYQKLVQKLLNQNISVVVTGGDIDRPILDRSGILNLPGVIDLINKTSGEELLAVLKMAKAVVAPSTGIAHLAAALGTRVVGLYSPVRVQAPVRWRPLGSDVRVFVPEVNCPGDFHCLGPHCKQYDCLDQISVDSVYTCVMEKI